MSELAFQIAEVMSVDIEKKTVTVQSREDGLIIPDIPIDNPPYKQYIPLIGQQVLILKLFDYDWRIVSEFGSESLSTQSSKPIGAGEIMMQGSGGGFFYADKAGNVVLSDKTLSNIIQLLVNTRINIVGDSMTIVIKSVGQITVTPSDGITPSSIKLTKINNGIPVANIVLQDGKISIDSAQVEIGPAPVASSVVTLSGVPGEYSFDAFGKPVPGSTTVKETL